MSREAGIGPRYHEASKYARTDMSGLTTWARPVPPYKEYAEPLSAVELPAPSPSGGLPLWQAIALRRSVREFRPESLSLEQLAQLLWAIQGVTAEFGQHALRSCASAGALYPNETYLFVNRVEGCPSGIWHYQVRERRLAQLAEGNFGRDLAQACLGQEFCATAAAVFAWGAVADRCAWKYGDRAFRYIYMDAGHLGAHLQLACVALGLGSVNIGAFYDDEVNALLALDGHAETVVYLTAVGHPA